jgi:MoaA/NifB/PqqE/SkfB family radical SAM enzyme
MPRFTLIRNVIAQRYELLRLYAYNLWHYGHPVVFSQIQIETYSPCNRKCSSCPVGIQKRPVTTMPDAVFRQIIDQLAERDYRGEIALHFYNEPLLDKRLMDFIGYAAEKCPRSHIYFATNGDYLEVSRFREMLHRGLSSVCISQYDKELSQNLRAFLSAVDDKDKEHFEHHLRIIDEISVWGSRGGTIKKWRLDAPLEQRCARPEVQMIVDVTGKVPLCCCDYFGQERLGDVTRENIFQIWRSRRIREIRFALRKGHRKQIPLCSGCNWFEERIFLPRKKLGYDTHVPSLLNGVIMTDPAAPELKEKTVSGSP